MTARTRHALALAALLAAPAPPAAPLRDAEGFRLAVAPYTFEFPRDHAAHPEYRTEWWYYSGHLVSGARRFGYELTFFRVGLPRARASSSSRWAVRELVFAHLALSDETAGRFRSFDAVGRPALGMAGADTARFAVWLDESRAGLAPDGRTHALRGVAPEFRFALALDPGKPPAVHGRGGVSAKGPRPGSGSHYYSLTRMPTRGTLVVRGDSLAVQGTSWMDHEFGSGRLEDTHAGWDWFALQLADGRELMLYQLRLRSGGIEPLSSGSLVDRDGRVRPLARDAFAIEATGRWTSARSGARYPSGWRVRVPSERLDLELEPTLRDQELTARAMGGVVYWEGSVRVRHAGAGPRAGEGYVELTGYAGPAPF
jgi:predicted secreted hydrolase